MFWQAQEEKGTPTVGITLPWPGLYAEENLNQALGCCTEINANC